MKLVLCLVQLLLLTFIFSQEKTDEACSHGVQNSKSQINCELCLEENMTQLNQFIIENANPEQPPVQNPNQSLPSRSTEALGNGVYILEFIIQHFVLISLGIILFVLGFIKLFSKNKNHIKVLKKHDSEITG